MEWVTRMGSTSKGPTRTRCRGVTSRRSTWSRISCSAARSRTRPRAYRGPKTGTSKRRRKYGIAPMWSSCPCVTKRPATRSPSRAVKSGWTTSTPRPRSSKVTPQSTIRAAPPCSIAMQFMPISPRPPSGRTRTVELSDIGCGAYHRSGRAAARNVLARHSRMSTLADKRFVLVTGKGGVGKTTVCAAEALALAAKGKRVLVAMCNARERLSVMLGVPPIGPTVAAVGENVWAVNIEPERALEEYGTLVLHSRALYKTLFDNRYVRTFLRAVPGMQEWAMLGKAWWHTTERRPDGSSAYDVVILDAPATGHGLDMLRVPRVILDIVPPGILRRDAERAWQMFQDPKTCAIVLVTLPEEMPTTETI